MEEGLSYTIKTLNVYQHVYCNSAKKHRDIIFWPIEAYVLH